MQHHAMPHLKMRFHAMSCNTMPRPTQTWTVLPLHAMPPHDMQCLHMRATPSRQLRATACHVIPCLETRFHATSCNTMPHPPPPNTHMQCPATACHAMQFYAKPAHATTPCHDAAWPAMLCRAIACHVLPISLMSF
eukprot:362571-Chlamydomonas_euryale.AAC.3